MKLSGKVVTGAKQAAYFTQLDWVTEQCLEKLGFKPYPGTLNLEVADEDYNLVREIKKEGCLMLLTDDPNFCAAIVVPVQVGNQDSAVVVPEEEVNIHKKNIVEIISGERLRSALDIDDGDVVTIKF